MSTDKIPDFSGLKEFKQNVDVWSTYVSRLKAWFTIQDVKLAEYSKYLVAIVGTEPLDLIIDLCYPDAPEEVSFDKIVTLVEEHLSPKRSLIAERMIFRSCKQLEGQSISEYLVQLKKMSKSCKFSSNEILKENLRDQFVYGLRSDRIRQRMLTEDDGLTLTRATELALSLEAAVRDSKPAVEAGQPASGARGEAEPVFAVRRDAARQRGGGSEGERARGSRRPVGLRRRGYGDGGRGGSASSGVRCYRCDGRHPQDQCPFKNSACYTCGDVGHIAKMCRFRQNPKTVHHVISEADEGAPAGGSDFEDCPLDVYQLSDDAEADAKWTVKVSDDIGYVVYSALGSFYIPSCIMVFVYIRIYYAAKARARRGIRKKPPRANEQQTSFSNPKGTRPMPSTHPMPPGHLSNNNGESQISTIETPQVQIPTVTCELASDISTSEAGDTCPPPPDERKDTLKVAYQVVTSAQVQKNPLASCPLRSSTLSVNGELQLQQTRGRAPSVAIDADMVSELEPSSSDSGVVSRCGGVKPLKLRIFKKTDRRQEKSQPCKSELEPALPKPHKPRDPEREKKRLARKKEKRATLILGLIMGSFIACWLPFFFLYILKAACRYCVIPSSAFAIAFWLGYMNSVLNPVIYTIFNKDFRRAFRRILFK